MKKPRKRPTFRSVGMELNHLHERIERVHQSNRVVPASLSVRFEELLSREGRDDGSISLQDHWGLLEEVRGDLDAAIWHREREVALVKVLFEVGGPIAHIDDSYLAGKLLQLAALYRIHGDSDKERGAIEEADSLRRPPGEVAANE